MLAEFVHFGRCGFKIKVNISLLLLHSLSKQYKIILITTGNIIAKLVRWKLYHHQDRDQSFSPAK